MQSKWIELKDEAIKLRKGGASIKSIRAALGIPLSTLSGWLRDIELTEEQKQILKQKHEQALISARSRAVLWHNQQKAIRIKSAEEAALKTLSTLDIQDKSVLDLAIAFLYLGEGAKSSDTTLLGNSNPVILKFFLTALIINYNLDKNKISCSLHLRVDQNEEELKHYWSKELGIPIENFTKTSIDKRTEGRTTYSYYKGVCVLNCGSVAIQRKLIYLSNAFAEKVIKKGRLAHLARAHR